MVILHGGRYVSGTRESIPATIQVNGSYVTRILTTPLPWNHSVSCSTEIDLSGFLLMPGLINAHDHLEFALFPRLANPPYRNYIEWATDIHNSFPDVIAKHRSVPKDVRLWWGAIRNLLCGVTTVSHHNPLEAELQRSIFPVKVIQEYGWGHSLAFGGDLRAAHLATPKEHPFIVHACEGIDEVARKEFWELDRLGVLDANTVIVHGLAIDKESLVRMQQGRTSLIVCPSSNYFLFGKIPDMSLLGAIDTVALGNDSPLTAEGDLLDEIRFAIGRCNIPAQSAYYMVTEAPAAILRLANGEGSIKIFGTADIIAVRDDGRDAVDRLKTLSMQDVEFVMIDGRIKLASQTIFERLPLSAKLHLEPLWIDRTLRWLDAPIKNLLQKAEEFIGTGNVRLGDKPVYIPSCMEVEYVCLTEFGMCHYIA